MTTQMNSVQLASVASCRAHDWQNKQEYVDDIQIKVQCCKDVFFRRHWILVTSSKHQLRVDHQVLHKIIIKTACTNLSWHYSRVYLTS